MNGVDESRLKKNEMMIIIAFFIHLLNENPKIA
jgi:hypothetical protein